VTRPKNYDIDIKSLEKEYWQMQKTLHPDHYGYKSPVRPVCGESLGSASSRTRDGQNLQAEQELSRKNSTYLNVAYKTLKDPTLRAKYLVSILVKLGCVPTATPQLTSLACLMVLCSCRWKA
jgi:hypothetical protein